MAAPAKIQIVQNYSHLFLLDKLEPLIFLLPDIWIKDDTSIIRSCTNSFYWSVVGSASIIRDRLRWKPISPKDP